MTKRFLTFSVIQIIALLLSFYLLAFAIVGSHGHLYFSNIGGAVALIMTIVLSTPLIYLFTQRHKLQSKKLLFIIATFFFILSMTVIYIGLPVMTKRFIIDMSNINKVSIYKDDNLTINFKLEPEMFDRVSIEATINRSNIDLNKLNFTVYNDKNQILKPVFQPLAWDSLHNETIQMDSFFEINEYTKMNKFVLSGEYSIEQTDSLKMKIDFAFVTNGQISSNHKEFRASIKNYLKLEKLIKY